MSLLKQKANIYANNLRENLEKENLLVGDLINKDYNFEFDVKKDKSKVKVLVYFSKKKNDLKTIIQGNKNNKLYKQVESIINGTLYFEEPELIEPNKYIGNDESGKGDLFGPLIVCAFAYDDGIRDELIKLDVKDSKKINDSNIISIYNQIEKKFKDRFEVVEIHPPKYNQLYDKIQNLNKILVWAHSKAIENLSRKFNYDCIVIDKFTSEKHFNSKVFDKKNLILEEKAERFLGVACASIIARSKLLKWFEKKSKELNIKLPFGSSSSVTKVANQIKKNYGDLILKDLIKLHFKNLKNLD
ncbi:MAG: ribonuclease HIII [Ignavibacterium sp.]|nr:ribonuclease HIII [Ignavibacterium sp.]